MSELKPCPFCGKEPNQDFLPEENFGELDTHRVMCIEHNSHFAVTIGLTADEAIKKWNTRAPVDAELSIYRSNDKSGVYAKRSREDD